MITHEEATKIFDKFGIRAEKIEDTVYKVINDTEEFNIDALEIALKECILLVSYETRYEKVPQGYSEEHASIYYILLDCDNGILIDKYNNISKQKRKTLITSFRYDPNHVESIDTIYTTDEIRLAGN